MSPAPRAASLRPSSIRSIARGAPTGTVSLALGEPGWELPGVAREALTRWAADALTCPYGPNEGLPELVEALTTWCSEPAERLMVTSGSQAALFAVFQAHVSPGAQVLVPDPGFPAYTTLATLAGADVVTYPVDVSGLQPGAVEAALGAHPGVALVVLNHPGNPTGAPAHAAALEQVARSCAARGVVVVSDEVYRELHRGEPQPSVREVSDTAVVVESVSKAWSAPGLRVGWATGPAELLAPARLVHHAMNTAPARPSQVAATTLLRHTPEVLAAARAALGCRWDLLDAASAALQPESVVPAGFYAWVPVPDRVEDPHELVVQMRDEGRVLVVPGLAFGPAGSRHVRISLGGPIDELAEGLQRLEPYWPGRRGSP